MIKDQNGITINEGDFLKVLFLTPHPIEGPSSRYRIIQFFPYLEKRGIHCTLNSFFSSGAYSCLYKHGFLVRKLISVLVGAIKRAYYIFRAGNFDAVYIHLELFPIHLSLLEKILKSLNKNIIYDLDDSIYLSRESVNKIREYFRRPEKLYRLLKASSEVTVCNGYLHNYARQYNKNITIIPTSLDTENFKPLPIKRTNNPIVIGWIGSHSTTKYLTIISNVLKRLAQKYYLIFKVVGSGKTIEIKGVRVINRNWSLERDVEEFQTCDIGVYPLPDDEWTKGKTGFKTIQFMAVGVPCVVSRVGANIEIVEDGKNGFLADSEEEWIEKLSRLIEDPELRIRMGKAGRKTIEERFSLNHNASLFHQVIMRAIYGG